MNKGTLVCAALGAALLLVAADVTVAGFVERTVRRKLTPAQDDGEESGRFWMSVKERGTSQRDKLTVYAAGLDATKDDGGDRPEYRVWLVEDDGETEADMGAVRLNRHGNARFRFNSRRTSLPDDVDSLADFDGGRIELRTGDDVVLDAKIPAFLDLEDENEKGTHARVFARDSRRLTPVDDDSRARGYVTGWIHNRPQATREVIVVEVQGAGRRGAAFTVVMIDAEDDETEIGTLKLRGRLRVGHVRLDTKRDDEIPGDGVLDLAGWKVEVRDGDGDVVLEGRFPSIP